MKKVYKFVIHHTIRRKKGNFLRRCKRCDKFYRTDARFSKSCPDCYKKNFAYRGVKWKKNKNRKKR